MTQSFHPDPGLDPNTMDIFATQLVRVFSSRQGDNTTDTVPLAPGCWTPGTLWHWRTPDHVSSVTTTLHSMSSFRNTFGPNGGGHIKSTHNYVLQSWLLCIIRKCQEILFLHNIGAVLWSLVKSSLMKVTLSGRSGPAAAGHIVTVCRSMDTC